LVSLVAGEASENQAMMAMALQLFGGDISVWKLWAFIASLQG
jgi:hypothetical protein